MFDPYEKEEKSRNKKLLERALLIFISALLVLLILFLVFGRSKTTRTHFSSVQTALLPAGENPEATDTELIDFYNAVSASRLVYGQDFRDAYPTVNKCMNDTDFCTNEIDLVTRDTGEYLCVIDGYISSYDYVLRGLDILLVPYSVEGNTLTTGTPVRFSVVYDTSLAQVYSIDFDRENYRLSFYSLSVTAEGGSAAEFFLDLDATRGQLKKQVKQLSASNPDGKRLDIESGIGDKVISGELSSGDFKLIVPFNDRMYEGYGGLSVTVADAGSFRLGIN